MRQTVIGMHGAHGELHAASLAHVTALAHTRPRPGPVAVIGDTNADQRRVSFYPRNDREEDPHAVAKEKIDAAAAAMGLRVLIP